MIQQAETSLMNLIQRKKEEEAARYLNVKTTYT